MPEGYTSAMSPAVARRLLTTADYHAMIAAGILGEDDRVELLAGEIFEAASIGSAHAGCVMRLTQWFSAHLRERALVNVQNPVELSSVSEPEPDLTLLVPRETYYSDRNPAPEDVLLLIEVADSSYDYDRNLKLPLYAKAGIREVWIVALQEGVVYRFREPVGREYERVERLGHDALLSSGAFPDLELPAADLFG